MFFVVASDKCGQNRVKMCIRDSCNIDDVCRSAAKLLKYGGRLCICNRPERLSDVITAMKNNSIEPKRIRFVSKNPESAPWLFLIEGRKGGKPFMKILPQLYVWNGNGYSEELESKMCIRDRNYDMLNVNIIHYV